MTNGHGLDQTLRDKILADPEALLDDADLMRALVAANDQARGPNVVDLRGLAMNRLEDRLDRLEDTHRSVIAAAYENLAGTQQIHRAILRMLEPIDFETFLRDLGGDVAAILRVAEMRLVLESAEATEDPAVAQMRDVLTVVPKGFVDAYMAPGRTGPRPLVVLRPTVAPDLYGGAHVGSEACMRLDFGATRLPGMLAMGANDVTQFTPQQGTDLLAFFAGVFERAMRRWLA